jgi:hypothetical protein
MHICCYYLQSFVRLDYFYNFVHIVRLVHLYYWGIVAVVVGAVEVLNTTASLILHFCCCSRAIAKQPTKLFVSGLKM